MNELFERVACVIENVGWFVKVKDGDSSGSTSRPCHLKETNKSERKREDNVDDN